MPSNNQTTKNAAGAVYTHKTFNNLEGSTEVHTTGVVPVDASGNPINDSNQLPVRVGVDWGAGATIGVTTGSAITTDTTGSIQGYLRGLVKWAFERMPASLGQKVAAASLPVVLPSDVEGLMYDIRVHQGVGTDTDSEATGNGSVIAILKRLRTLLAGGLPASLGQKAMNASLAVVIASDQTAVSVRDKQNTSAVEEASVAVGTTVVLVRAANSAILSSMLYNKSDVRVFLGTTNGVTGGINGTNFAFLDQGQSLYIKEYLGNIYAITETDVAYVGVLSA